MLRRRRRAENREDLDGRPLVRRGTTPRFTCSRTRCTTASASSRGFAATRPRPAARRSSAFPSTLAGCSTRRTILGLKIPFSRGGDRTACVETVRVNQLRECYIRPLVFVGDGEMGVPSALSNPVRVAIVAWPWGAYLGDDGLKNGIRVKTSLVPALPRQHADDQGEGRRSLRELDPRRAARRAARATTKR